MLRYKNYILGMQVLLYSISQGIVWKPGIIEKICFIYLTCFEKLENTKKWKSAVCLQNGKNVSSSSSIKCS